MLGRRPTFHLSRGMVKMTQSTLESESAISHARQPTANRACPMPRSGDYIKSLRGYQGEFGSSSHCFLVGYSLNQTSTESLLSLHP